MNTPWINYKEIRQIDINRKAVFFITKTQEQTKLVSDDRENEKAPDLDPDYVSVDPLHTSTKTKEGPIPQENPKENHIPALQKKMKEGKDIHLHQAPYELNDIQKKFTSNTLAYPINVLTKGYFISKIKNLKKQKRFFQLHAPLEMDDGLDFNIKSFLNSSLAPDYFETAVTDLKASVVTISPIANTQKVIEADQTIQMNDSTELAIGHAPSVIDSQNESEFMDFSITDDPSNQVNLNDAEIVSTDFGKTGIALRLVNILKRVQTSKTHESPELSAIFDFPTPNEAGLGERVHDLQSESSYIAHPKRELISDGATNNIDTEETDALPDLSTVYCKRVNSTFSTFIELQDFRHAPVFGGISQNRFNFLDSNPTETPEVDTTFISTSTYYPQQPSVHLVSSVIHELFYLTKTPFTNDMIIQKTNDSKSLGVPVHSSTAKDKSNSIHDSIKIRVPVVVGEYNIEICIKEEIPFEEEVVKIKKISKNIELKKCHFKPTHFADTVTDGTRAATSGLLSIDGVIEQNIEYTALSATQKHSKKTTERINLQENISLMLVVQLLQEQGIYVNYHDTNGT